MTIQKNIIKATRLFKEKRYHKSLAEILPILCNIELLKENKKARQQAADLFTKLIAYQESIIFLKELLAKSDNKAQAFVYLADFVRDHGGSLIIAINLYKISLSYDKSNIEILALLLNALEAYGNKAEAFNVGIEALKYAADLKIAKVEIKHVIEAALSNDQKIAVINSKYSKSKPQNSSYSKRELRIIDICFQLTKILFCQKKIGPASLMIKILQPIRQAGGNLHLGGVARHRDPE